MSIEVCYVTHAGDIYTRIKIIIATPAKVSELRKYIYKINNNNTITFLMHRRGMNIYTQ